MHACMERVTILAPSLSLRAACTILWAMGRLRHRSPPAEAALAEAITARVTELQKIIRGRPHDAPTNSKFLGLLGSAAQSIGEGRSTPETDNAWIGSIGQFVSMALHACATLGMFRSAPGRAMMAAALRFASSHRESLSPQSLANACWAAAVAGEHSRRSRMMPLLRESLLRSPEMKAQELAQLAQVDVALRLETNWYTGGEWLSDGNLSELLSGLHCLRSDRCACSWPGPFRLS
jgi:hypothetical protein